MIKVMDIREISLDEILKREEQSVNVAETVGKIISDVKQNGDSALLEYTRKFDKTDLVKIEVTPDEISEAYSSVDPELVDVMNKASENIRKYHSKQVRNSFIINDTDGVIVGQKIIPIEKAGIYVPGGTAAYPSTVLMDTIPAKIAGCSEVIMVTPPKTDGSVPPAILVAADIAGVNRIFKVGGAQAIAALAYGTETIPKVDKIVGPGNVYVAEAKKQVYGTVSIDMIAGPSEILIVADENSNPEFLAADLLSQAEHDVMATAVLITDAYDIAYRVSCEIEKQINTLKRKDIAKKSIDTNGKIIITRSVEEAIDISNLLAPEHLELSLSNPFDYLDRVKNAGSVFLGYYCPEALGDYYAGPNHTLPTSGTARFSSPLSVDDFIKKTQYTYYSKNAFEKIAQDVTRFADSEGLTGHGISASIRCRED